MRQLFDVANATQAEFLCTGVVLLRGFACALEVALLDGVRATVAQAPLRRLMRSGVFSLLLSTLCCAPVASAQPFAPRLYEVVTETGLPHLEENLRYLTTHSKLCISRAQLATAFPILQHEALKGCKLDHERSVASSVHLLLSCEAGNSTTGVAEWQVDELGIRGTLDVKLGGKNMTLYQRISGRPVGGCVPGD